MNRYFPLFALLGIAICLPTAAKARGATEAQVTKTANDVQIIDENATAHPAAINDNIAEKTVIKTGLDSHAEVTFSDQTVARLAAETSLTFEKGGRGLILEKGAILIEAPKHARVTKIQAGPATAAIAGTTAMLEHHPKVCKYLVLQGTGRLYRPKHWGDSILVRPGQMTIGDPETALSDPVDFDIGRFIKTSRFIVDFSPLPSAKLIAAESDKQQRDKSKKVLIDTNLIIFGGGTMVSVVDPANLDLGREKTTASPNPSPSAIGAETNPTP